MCSNFIETRIQHGCFPEGLLHIFRGLFNRSTSERLLLQNRFKPGLSLKNCLIHLERCKNLPPDEIKTNLDINQHSYWTLKAGLYDEIFLSRPWNFYFARKVSKYFRKRNVCREKLFRLFKQSSFIHTIMIRFHSLRERVNNFHFSCHRFYSFKSCLKTLKKRSQLCC